MSISGWRGFLDEKEEALRAYTREWDHPVPDGLLDEDGFLSRFQEFCARSKVKTSGRRTQLYNKFIDSFGPMIKISEGLSRLAPDNGRFESLVYKTSLTALELQRQCGENYEAIITLQVALHGTVPKLTNLNTTLDRWSDSKYIQEALKVFYEAFIDLDIDVIKTYTTDVGPAPNTPSDETFEMIKKKARTLFSNAEDAYERAIKRAEQSEAAISGGQGDASLGPLTTVTFEFKPLNQIGEGSHGIVYRVEEKTTQELYACKQIRMSKPALRGSTKSEVKEEILVLKKLRHTHIVQILTYSQEDSGFTIIMDPLADYDLKKFLGDCAKEKFPDAKTEIILPWFACVLQALRFAHSQSIKHRDIKMGNILVKGPRVYLSDFSLAKDFTGQDTSVADDEVAAGTLRYRAPETKNNVAGGRLADVFSLGCVFIEMLTVVCGRPFEELCERQKANHATDLFRDSLPTVEEWLREMKQRFANEETVKAERVKAMYRIIRKMIEVDPEKRHSAQEALISVEQIRDLHCVHT